MSKGSECAVAWLNASTAYGGNAPEQVGSATQHSVSATVRHVPLLVSSAMQHARSESTRVALSTQPPPVLSIRDATAGFQGWR